MSAFRLLRDIRLLPCAPMRILLQVATAFSLAQANTAFASPGPPPPEYIINAARQVIPTQTAATFGQYAAELANDLTVWVNDKEVASDKATWLALERHRLGKVDRRVLGYVEGYDSVLVIDRYDDRSDLPEDSHAIFDPRYKTRAVRYRFGPDHLVHVIRIIETDGLMQTPP